MEGKVLSDRYELGRSIGAGGMSVVHEATDRVLGRRVAVKVLGPHLAADPDVVRRFDREAKSAAALDHPGIVRVYDADVADGVHFLVMELVEGPTLAEVLRRGPLPPDQVEQMGVEVCAALAHAHARGVVHRDVKPGNILLTEQGPRLADFGIALAAESTDITRTGTLLGTAAYLSPEQAAGGRAEARSDLYSLGCTLYEALQGRPPFVGETAMAVAVQHIQQPPPPLGPHVPDRLATVVMRVLSKDPVLRFAGAEAMAAALGGGHAAEAKRGLAAAITQTFAVAPTTVLDSPRPPARRVGGVGWLVGAAVVLAVVAAALAALRGPAQDPAVTTPAVTTPAPRPPAAVAETPAPEPEPTPQPASRVREAAQALREVTERERAGGRVSDDAAEDVNEDLDDVLEEYDRGRMSEARKKAEELPKRIEELRKDGEITPVGRARLNRAADELVEALKEEERR